MHGGFWGLQHLRHAAAAEASAAGGRSSANEAARTARDLQEQVEKLTLICMAMWSMVQDVFSFTEEDLMRRVRDLDLMDGNADGKITRRIAKCPKCNRVMSPKHKRCLYCGFENLKSSTFDEVT